MVTANPFFEGLNPAGQVGVASLVPWLSDLDAGDDQSARLLAREIAQRLGEAGVTGAATAQNSLRACCLIRQELAYYSPLADAVFALQALGSRPILLAGSTKQQGQWIPGVTSGRAIAAFAMTEPEAGSDVLSLQTKADKDGDSYVLNGSKTFISNAGIADFYTTFVRSGERTDGRAEITCLVVAANTPGCAFVEAQELAEPHPLGTIEFDNCRVPVANQIGGEGEGYGIGMQTLDLLRPTVAAAACGMAARALDEATAHARSRRQFGQRLGQFQLIQAKLADMATELEAARLLVYRAAWFADTHEPDTLASSQAKLFATEAAQRIVDQAVQILGGRGVVLGNPVERLYRAVRALRIYEGSSEVQKLVIARKVLDQEQR